MVTTSAQIASLLIPGLDAVFGDYDEFAAEWPAIFEKHTSELAYERDVEVKTLGLAQLRTEGGATSYEDMGQRYTYVYKHVQPALGFVMTRNSIRDNVYKADFGPNTRALKFSMRQTKEVWAASVLNNSVDTTGVYYGGDAQPLLSTAHPIDVGTVANTPVVATQLNETAIQDADIAVARFRDAAGNKILVQPQRLVIPPDQKFTAARILRTDLRVGTSDNDKNILKEMGIIGGGFRENHFLTNVNSWFIITNCPDGLKYFQRDPLETDIFVDYDTDNLKIKATERFSFGWSNWRAIFGSMP
jgi:hypothetical protein